MTTVIPAEDIRIPASVVPSVYRHTYLMFGNAANGVQPLVERPDCELYPERFQETLASFDQARGLLDALGWKLRDGDVHIGVRQGPVLLEVVEMATRTAADMLESGRKDRIEPESEHQMAADLDALRAFKAAVSL